MAQHSIAQYYLYYLLQIALFLSLYINHQDTFYFFFIFFLLYLLMWTLWDYDDGANIMILKGGAVA